MKLAFNHLVNGALRLAFFASANPLPSLATPHSPPLIIFAMRSRAAGDMMFFTQPALSKIKIALSDRDINTIRRFYSISGDSKRMTEFDNK